MKIAVLGSGMVGRALASRLVGLGHEVVIGTRDEEITLARTEPDAMGQAPYAEWQHANPAVRLVRFSDAAAHGELVINATAGASSLAALDQAGAANLAGKIIVELANALSFSQGRPPLLSVANTDSLGEQIQRAYSDARVVKALNTVAAAVMIDPGRVPGHQASSSSPVRTTTPRTRSSACWASSAGRRRRSSTSVDPRRPSHRDVHGALHPLLHTHPGGGATCPAFARRQHARRLRQRLRSSSSSRSWRGAGSPMRQHGVSSCFKLRVVVIASEAMA